MYSLFDGNDALFVCFVVSASVCVPCCCSLFNDRWVIHITCHGDLFPLISLFFSLVLLFFSSSLLLH